MRKFPCITIDGCDKACARRGVEKLGETPVESIVLSDFFTPDEYKQIENSSKHDLAWLNHEFCNRLAEHIGTSCLKYLDHN